MLIFEETFGIGQEVQILTKFKQVLKTQNFWVFSRCNKRRQRRPRGGSRTTQVCMPTCFIRETSNRLVLCDLRLQLEARGLIAFTQSQVTANFN